MLTKKICRDIFIDPSKVNLDEVDKFLDKYGLKIFWCFEEGIMFDYPPTLDIRYDPGDISFTVAGDSKAILLTVNSNFGALEFFNSDQELVYSIEILDE